MMPVWPNTGRAFNVFYNGDGYRGRGSGLPRSSMTEDQIMRKALTSNVILTPQSLDCKVLNKFFDAHKGRRLIIVCFNLEIYLNNFK